jgi:hypothetical protein
MKTCTFFILCALLLCSVTLRAQENFPRSEFSLRYGLVTNADIIELTSDLLTSVFTFGSFETRNNISTGAFSFEYQYRPKKWVSVGGSVSYERTTCDLFSKNLDIDAGNIINNYYTVMATARFNYLSKKIITLYSRVGIGYTLWLEYINGDNQYQDQSDGFVAFQLTPIGIRIGTKVGGFFEAGFGSEGMVAAGVSFRF